MITPGWSSFTNIGELKYKVTYIVNGDIYTTCDVAIGSKIPTDIKEGYTFVCDNMPTVMPSNDVTLEGSFTVNNYTITYFVDGEEYKVETVAYGSAITLIDEPTKEGYTFSGWSEAPSTMPAKDIIITGSFILNVVDVISIVLDKSSIVLNVGDEVKLIATITPENATDKSMTWYASNPFVATVEDGIVTAVGEGEAVITALAGNKVAVCIVKVLKNDTAIDSVNDDNVTKEIIYDLNGNRIVDAKILITAFI